MGDNALLELIIKAKDEATAVLNGVGKSVDDTAKKAGEFSKTMKLAGGILTGAGVAGVAMMSSWIDKASEVEVAEAQLKHAVLQVSHATEEQLQSTMDLADALERKGVLDGDNIKIGLAQLSTFGLSNKAVQGLGGSLADLAVNQFGVKASGDQLSQTANMIAKALNGQFGVLEKSGIRFSEAQRALIEFGTEEEKVKAINEGFAQNLKFTNDVAKGTAEGMKAHLGVQLENIQETLGTKLLPAFAKIIEAISKFADFISNMNPKVLETVAIVVAIGSAFGLVVGPILMLIGFLPALTAGFAMISGALLPAIGIIAGIVAVALLAYTVFKNWDKIVDFIKKVGDAIAGFFALLFKGDFSGKFGRALGIDEDSPIVVKILNFRNKLIATFNGLVSAITGFFSGAFTAVTGFFTAIFDAVVGFLTPIIDFYKAYFTILWNIYSYVFTQIYTLVKFVIEGIWAIIQIVFTAIVAFLTPILNAIWSVISTVFNAIYGFISGIFNAIWGVISSVFNTVYNFLSEIITAIWTYISEKFNAGYEYLAGILGAIWSVISEKFNAVKTVITEIWTSITTWFGEKLDAMWSKVTDIAGKIKGAFTTMANGIKEALTSIKFPHLSIGSGTVNVGGKDISYPKLNVDWYEQGGWVRNTGLAVVHQGEFVMSKDMLAGRKSTPSVVTNKSQPITINLVANTPVDLDLLSYKLAYALRNN